MEAPNILWYILLGFLSLCVFFFTLWKSQEKVRLFKTYFFISGLSYFLDFTVIILFNGYEYKPHVFSLLWFDSTFGSVFSQAIAVPIAAVAIAGFNLGFIPILLISILFMGIEELFLALDVYDQHWWKTWYTGLNLIIAFYLAKVWYRMLDLPSKRTIFSTLYMTLIVYTNTLSFFLVALCSIHLYSPGWYDDPIRDNIAGNSIYLFIILILVTIVILKFRWYWVVLLLALEWMIDKILIENGVLHLAPYWNIYYYLLLLLATVLLFRFVYIKWFIVKQ